MSGGYFNHSQYNIEGIAEDIKQVIETKKYLYSEETVYALKNAYLLLKSAFVYAHRIDWLLSYDDGEEMFHKRLEKDLEKLQEHLKQNDLL